MFQEGELNVVGEGEVEIDLVYFRPRHVAVFFMDQPIPVPCNPHHHDHLHWHLKHKRHNHKEQILVITWKVQNTRLIKWKIKY